MVAKQTIPHWLKNYLRASDLEKIQQAVRAAESSTSAEIVPLIVRQSSCVGHVQPTLFLILCVLGLLGGEAFHERFSAFSLPLQLAMAGAGIVLAYAMASFLQRFHCLRRLLTNKIDLDYQTHMRAEVEFYENNLHTTTGATGVLIFISMMEHEVVVLSDQAISEKLAKDTWIRTVDTIIASIKQKRLGEGLVASVSQLGKLLSESFPIQPQDQNELHDRVVIKE